MSDPLVVISSSSDRQACLGIAARLERLGIPAVVAREPDFLPLGAPRFAVSVPAPVAAEAVRHLSKAPGDGPYRSAPAEPKRRIGNRRRPRRLAVFFAIGLGFGFGHVYAREYLAAMILGLGQLVCLALASRGAAEMLLALPVLVGLDAYGAFLAVHRENEGESRGSADQLAATLPCVALCLASASLLVDPPAHSGAPAQEAAWTSR